MPATLTNITPATGNPGDQIILIGTGFLVGAVVTFVGGGQSLADPNAALNSATQITATVPDFGGDALQLAVNVQNAGEDATADVAFALKQYPPVEAIYPLVSLNAVRATLGLGDDKKALDATLRRQILMASAAMLGVITVDIKPVTVTGDLYDGDGTSALELRRSPVVSVSRVAIDGQSIDIGELKVYPEYIAFDGADGEWNPRIQAFNRIFPCGRQNIEVDYIAGYVNVPADISMACIEQVTFIRNTLSKQGVISDANSQTSATTMYSQRALAPHVAQVCNQYRRTEVKVV